MTREQFQARIADLIGKGYTPRAAERTAKRERRRNNPRHKAAVARRCEYAAVRFEATGDFAAFNAIEVTR